MNEGAAREEELGEPLGDASFEAEAGWEPIEPIEPIDPIEPTQPDDDGGEKPPGATELAKLLLATPEKDEIKSGEPAKLFAAIRKLQVPEADPDDLNNVGCAWALLAFKEPHLDYWQRARHALDASSAHDKATERQKDRVKKNLAYIEKAREEMEST